MKQTPPLTLYKKIATLFIVLTVGLVVFLLYFSLTYAYVTINPKVNAVSYDFNAVITDNEELIDSRKGVFKGETKQYDIEKTSTFDTTGVKQVRADSTGKVTIINNNSKDQALIATTRLLTSKNELLRIKTGVTVPAGGRTEAEYYQDDKAQEIGLDIGQRLTIPGLSEALQAVVYAEVLEIAGGESKEVRYVAKEDLDSSLQKVVEEIKSEVAALIPAGTSSIIDVKVTDKTFTKLVGEDADTFSVTVKASVTEVRVPTKEISSYAQGLLESNLHADSELYDGAGFGIAYTLDEYNKERSLSQISGVVSSGAILRAQSSALQKQKLAGLSREEVIAYLSSVPEIEKVTVNFFPFWIKKVPTLADHIIVEVVPEALIDATDNE